MRNWALPILFGATLWACTVPADGLVDSGEAIPDIVEGGAGPADNGGSPGAQGGAGGAVVGAGGGAGQIGPGLGGTSGMGGTGVVIPGQGGQAAGGTNAGGSPGTGGTANMGGTVGSGGMVVIGGRGGIPGDEVVPDTARYNFEQSVQDWQDLGASRPAGSVGLPPVRVADRALRGAWSLRYDVSVPAGRVQRVVGVGGSDKLAALVPGAKITFNVWVPAQHKLLGLQAFAQTEVAGSWISDSREGTVIGADAWTQLSLVVPANWGRDKNKPLELGVFLSIDGPWTGSIFIDSVDVK